MMLVSSYFKLYDFMWTRYYDGIFGYWWSQERKKGISITKQDQGLRYRVSPVTDQKVRSLNILGKV